MRPITLILLLLALPLAGQQYSFETYSEDNGLSNLDVQAMLQDHSGYLWIGTQNGLYRYDGSHFEAFGREQGLTDTLVTALHETRNGQIWVGTRSGLFGFESGRLRAVNGPGSPSEIRFQLAFASDSRDTLYVATSKGLLIGERGRPRVFRLFRDVGLPDGGAVTSVAAGAGDVIWFSSGSHLYRLSDGRLTCIEDKSLPQETWKAIAVDRHGTVWLRSPQRTLFYDVGAKRFRSAPDGLPSGETRGYLTVGADGEILVPTDHGLARLEGGKWVFTGQINGLPGDSVCCVVDDHEGSRWIGMRGTGLARSRTWHRWESWTRQTGLASDEIWSIARDSAGRLWAGTSAGSQTIPAGGPAVPVHGVVSSLVSDPRGSMWAATADGHVLSFDVGRRKWQVFGPESGLGGSNILAILSLTLDRTGHLWASTTEGLFVAEAGPRPRFRRVAVFGEASRMMFHQTVEDATGTIWAASEHGLFRFQDGKWKLFGPSQGLRHEHVTGVAVQKAGDVWVSYGKSPGVSRLVFRRGELGKEEQYSRANGLHSDQVVSLAVDARDRVWMGGEGGVDMLAHSGWRYFGRAQGLIWSDCNSNALFADPDGSMWIGTSHGLSHFKAELPEPPSPPPAVSITFARFGADSLEDGHAYRLQFREDPLLIRLAALTFDNERAVRFRYRLTGADSDWVEGSGRELRYPALHPGSYRFEVEAKSADGIWSVRKARFDFVLRPPWWETWWFRVFEEGIVFLGIYRLWIWRTAHLKRRQLELEQAVAERTRELEAERKKFETLATWDSVTGVWNRRAIFELLSSEMARARRSGKTLAVIMADLDHFKRVNDTYGHQAGDAVLCEAAKRMKGAVRVSDGLGRYGGEEFLMILPECEGSVALLRAEQIRRAVCAQPIDTPAGPVAVTCSLGVNWTTVDSYATESLIEQADAALYRAKHAGRNRVETARECSECANEFAGTDFR